MSRGPRRWPLSAPRPTLPHAASPDLDEQADALVALLRERGPMGARELHAAARARYWGPGAFGDALAHARAQGRVARVGRRRYAATS
jgi:hypothetical protein